MNPLERLLLQQTRRTFLSRTATSIGSIALASMLNPRTLFAEDKHAKAQKWRGVINPLHFAPKAKRVIFLCMAGGPSHLETFDPKPRLAELHGQPMPESFTKGQQIAQLQGAKLNCFAPQFPFAKVGKSGQEISTILPHISSIADDICIIRSMHTEQINHDPAHTFLNSGTAIAGRPSMGSWILYGLGSECENLPGFVVLVSVGAVRISPSPHASGAVGFCRAGSRVLCSTPAVIRCFTSRSRAASRTTARRQLSRPSLRLTKFLTVRRTTRRSPRASANMKWLSECSRVFPG